MQQNPGLFALALGTFSVGVSEFAPMGLLPLIALAAVFTLGNLMATISARKAQNRRAPCARRF